MRSDDLRIAGILPLQPGKQRDGFIVTAGCQQAAGFGQALHLALFGFVFTERVEQPGDLVVFGKLLLQFGQQRAAFFVAPGRQKFSGFRDAFLPVLLCLIFARGFRQPGEFGITREFLLQCRPAARGTRRIAVR